MVLYVCGYHLICYGARRGTEIPTRPQMLPPIPFAQRWILFLQLTRRFAFDVLHHIRHRQSGWCRHKQVHVISADMPFQDYHVMLHTYISDYVSRSQGYFTFQHMVSVLRYPYKVIFDIVNRVRSFAIAILAHRTTSVASLSQKSR
jgi:hypothetical protein